MVSPPEKSVSTCSISGPPPLPTGWTRCHYWMAQKKRFCRQEPTKNSEPPCCGNHQHLLLPLNSTTKRKRIPCPIDPSHMIFEDSVGKHLSVCPQTKKRRSQEEQDFYCEKINSGGHGTLPSHVSSIMNKDRSEHEILEWAKRIALRVIYVHQQLFLGETVEDPARVSLDDIIKAIPLQDLSTAEFNAGIERAVCDYKIRSGGMRHVHQQASLIGHLRRIGALKPLVVASSSTTMEQEETLGNGDSTRITAANEDVTILEVGAGRGMSGLIVAGVAAVSSLGSATTNLIMVERGGSRGKADTVLRKAFGISPSSNYMNLAPLKWRRIRCDLSHVDMKQVLDAAELSSATQQQNKNQKLVVLAKHLCGVGTDLALRSMEPIKERISACVMATCCHGVCVWNDYVGRDYLRDAMRNGDDLTFAFGQDEFELLRRWSSGTVRDVPDGSTFVDPDDITEDRCQHLQSCDSQTTTGEARTINVTKVVETLRLDCGVCGLGRACQRLIDFGRREYLQHNIFSESKSEVELVCSVAAEISPQNAALVASRR